MRRVVVGIVVLGALCAAGPASAHLGGSTTVLIVDGVRPSVAGIVVAPVESIVGKISLSVASDALVVVLGAEGQPIFRVGPDGVEANAAAPEWYQDNEPLGIAVVPPDASAAAPERWVRVSTQPRWEWFDHRLHPAGRVVDRWSIPIEIAGHAARIDGHHLPRTERLSLALDPASVPPGLEVRTIDVPSPALSIHATAAGPFDVLGGDGELFARLTPAGAQVNRHSPVWAAAAQVSNRDLLGAVIDPTAPVDLGDASRSATLVWPDPRLLPAPGQRSAEWSIPVVVAPGQVVRLRGRTQSVAVQTERAQGNTPASAGPATGKLALLVGATLLVVAGLWFAVRRRST